MRKLAKRSVSMLLTAAMLFGEPMSAFAAQDVTAGDLPEYVQAGEYLDSGVQNVFSSTNDGDESVPGDEAETVGVEEATPEVSEGSLDETVAAVSEGDAAEAKDVSVGDLPENVTGEIVRNCSIVEDKGKFYCYNSAGAMLKAETNSDVGMVQPATIDGEDTYVCVNTEGELQKGAVLYTESGFYTTDKAQAAILYYFDLKTFCMVKNQWVEYNGGFAYIGSNGFSAYDYGIEADLQGTKMAPVNGRVYIFYQGVAMTGWIYLDEKGAPVKNAKAAKYTYYANAAGMIQEGEFTVAGKTYYCDTDTGIYKDGLKNVSRSDSYNDWYYFDANGVVQNDKIVSAKITVNSKEYEGQFYLDRDAENDYGRGLYVGLKMIKGKMMNFNPTLEAGAETVYSGARAFYVDPKTRESNTAAKEVYVKIGTGKNAGTMTVYEDEAGTKALTSVLVEPVSGEGWYYIDAKGKVQTGFVTVCNMATVKNSYYTYYADPETGRFISNDDSDLVLTVKKKSYLLSTSGVYGKAVTTAIQTRDHDGWTKNLDEETCYVDQNGVIVTGFATIEKNGQKNKYYFAPENYTSYYDDDDYSVGTMLTGIFAVGSKAYLADANGVVGGKAHFDSSRRLWINADGSVKTGWLYLDGTGENANLTNAKKAALIMYVANSYGGPEVLSGSDSIFRIGGKCYYFGSDGNLVTGMKPLEYVRVVDPVTMNRTSYNMGCTFYFDPKKGGAMATGWQQLTLSSEVSGKYYFMKEDTIDTEGDKYPAGALAYDVTIKIGKVVYQFSEDGVATTVKPGRAQDKTVKTEKVFYYYDSATGMSVTNAVRKTGNKWYFYGADGKAATTVPENMIIDENENDVSVEFAKDGSIAGFKDGSGNVLKDTMLSVNNYAQPVVLDAKGKPKTGLVSASWQEDSLIFYLDTDGAPYDTAGHTSMIKVGKKYYVCRDGMIMTADSDLVPVGAGISLEEGYGIVPIQDFSKLPAKDQKILNASLVGGMALGASSQMVYVNESGEAVPGKKVMTRSSSGRNMYYVSDSYGIVRMTLMYKEGKKWYYGGAMGYDDVTLRGVDGTIVTAKINCKANGELISFTDTKTGKALTGTYSVYSSFPGIITLAKGLPKTGMITVKSGGAKRSVYVDPNVGMLMILGMS